MEHEGGVIFTATVQSQARVAAVVVQVVAAKATIRHAQMVPAVVLVPVDQVELMALVQAALAALAATGEHMETLVVLGRQVRQVLTGTVVTVLAALVVLLAVQPEEQLLKQSVSH